MSTPTVIKVRGYHLDIYGHVNNARYLEFLEEARWATFEDKLDLAYWRERHLAFVIVNLNINYRRPAEFGDVLEITCEVSRLGNKSGTISQEIRLQGYGTVVADADLTFVMVDERDGRAVPLEGEPRRIMGAYMSRGVVD